MEFTGNYLIPARRDLVWRALNDEVLLQECIPGCRALDWVSEHELSAKIGAKIGPVESVFKGKIELSDVVPGRTYTMSVSGKGMLAGSAKGIAKISLSEVENDPQATLLTYEAHTSLTGLLASVSQKLVAGAGQKLADKFWARFSDLIGQHYGNDPD